MNNVFVRFVFCLFLMFYAHSSIAEDDVLVLEDGVKAHEGIDLLYHEFAKAYETLDADHYKSIYADQTYYLAPKSPIYFNNSEVADKGFREWFEYVKQSNGSLSVVFNIIAREVDENLAYDVGYIKSTQKIPELEDEVYEFKILAISKKQADGEWRFQADTYSYLE